MIFACPECRNQIDERATSCKCGWSILGAEPHPQTSFQLDWQRLYDKVCQGFPVDDKCLVHVVGQLWGRDPIRLLQLTHETEYVRNPFYEIPLTTKLAALTVHSWALLYLLRNARYLPVDLATMILEVVED